MITLTHRWKDGKCECGCQLDFKNIKGRGKCRIYSFDGFKTYVVGSPACTRIRVTKAKKMEVYREKNKERISAYAKRRYLERKKMMFQKVMQPV